MCASAAEAQESAQRKLPSWLELGVEFRGRVEGGTAVNYIHDNDDIYYLHRIRGTVGIKPTGWLRFFMQPQHTEAVGRRPPVPNTQADGFDFHQSFVEFTGAGERRWSMRAGRQEVNFGRQRLVGSSNWGNTSRSFDALRVSYETKRVRMDWFASTVVRKDPGHLNRFTTENQLHGAHFSSKDLLARGTFESYLFWKINPHEPSETGRLGRTSMWTAGVRAEGPLPFRFDYSIETAIQGGRLGGDDHQAWGGYYTFGYKLTNAELTPRLIGAFTHASGDKRFGDGRFGTFDMLFPTNHANYGWANRHAWRNMHEAMGGVVLRPASKWVVNLEYHTSWLASLEDALYNFNGRPVVRNPNATSGHTDHEVDAYAVFNASRRVQFVLGICRVFPTTFLKESTPGAAATVPYLQWRYTL